MTTTTPINEALWRPGDARIDAARITVFQHWLHDEYGHRFDDYDTLWKWSVDQQEAFWAAVWRYFDILATTPYSRVLSQPGMPGARWFEGAELNFVDQVFRHRELASPALIFESEAGGQGEMSWRELEGQVGACAATLRRLGVGRGDRVIAYLPNTPQAVVAFLASASLGAIWSICAPDMGQTLVQDRFRQIEPKLLIACDGYRYGGKDFDRRELVAGLLDSLPTVELVVWVPLLYPRSMPDWPRPILSWESAVSGDVPLRTAAVPFGHPLWVLYSSGTTGLPKAIVHSHGGMLLNGLVFVALHNDTGPGDRFFWMSSSGWMMWNVQIMGLLTGATAVLFDGAVTGPRSERDWGYLWRFVDRHKLNLFGIGAAFHAACLKDGIKPAEFADLSALRTVGSTGSPLSPECYQWIYEHVKQDVWLSCVSGGTDICGAFLGGTPTLPVYSGEMQCRILGADVHAYNETGQAVVDEVGELVCTRPLPSMPLYFWNDTDNRRYRESYFDTYHTPEGDAVWRHGDWLRLTPRAGALGAVIYGRSDATINRQGIRMGTAELYRAVELLQEVMDSLVVDLEHLGRNSCMVLFVVLRPGLDLDEALERRIRQSIRVALSPRHVPDDIVQATEIPRTLTGKKVELPIKKLMLGQPADKVINRDALDNPGCIDWYIDFARQHNTGRSI